MPISYVFMEGKGGQTVRELWAEAEFVRLAEPQALIIDIGSNDLCDPNLSPEHLVLDIIEPYSFLLTHLTWLWY